MTTASDLALEYFQIGNGVTAFYVVQTLLFVNALYKEPKLVEVLCNDRQRSRNITWGIAIFYIIIVLGCLLLEVSLRSFYEDSKILLSSLFAGSGRIIVIFIMATACSRLISVLKQEPNVV